MTTPELSSAQDRRDADVLTRILEAALAPEGSDAWASLGALLRELRETDEAALQRISAMIQLRKVGARISTAH